uniref:KIAA0825 n=1 Tax=Gasterosteus aculeatus aculeatus TaxID=481459 RepID=G3P827_GASAC
MEWPADFPEDHAFVEPPVPGLPSELDFEQLLKDAEEKLNLNANSIERQLKELQAKMGDSRERPPSPSECLQWFNIKAHNSFRPVNTGHQELLDFFGALNQYLGSEDAGKEEVTLQLLLDLSGLCGICFPCTPSSSSCPSSLNASSVHLVHQVRDDAPLEIQEAWNDVRLQLQRHLLDRLSSQFPGHPAPRHISVTERVHCLRQLFFLYPESEALTHYQGLRSRSVLALLVSALSSSPGGESGFDRLAKGFRNAAPALTQALQEEIHVLSRLAEPCTLLGFLNVAYFSTVAQELASLMERESETALRDNTTLSGKIKKYSARSRATVAPMELPMKGRSFSLTSHQLRALTQLACTLLGFERTVKELVTNLTVIDCTGETRSVKGILKKNREDLDMTTDCKKSTAEALLHMPEAHVLEFDWRSAFIGLVPHMAHCVKVVLDDVCTKSLQKEEALHSSGQTSITLSRTGGHTASAAGNTHLREDSFYTYSERETPKMIAKFCGAIMSELDALLPLAAACRDSSLLEVRSSFVEGCSRTVFSMLSRLQGRALEVPSSAPLRNLPALLATCIYVHQRLEHYHARLKDSNTTAAKVSLTLLPIQKYQDTVEALRDQLVTYCIQVCSTCILQDAESHHWADPKPFYEGERCSFSVQMWFYFLRGLRSDLWLVLPAEMAKDVLGQVLSETLQLLVQRYARARPSYKRHMQIRCDITALLLYVEELMWSVCESPEALVRSNPSTAIAIIAGGSDWLYQIHSLCDQLLTVLVIVTAPLSLLYRVFMNNPAIESTQHQPDSHVVHWLNAINLDLFSEEAVRDGLLGQAASLCQLRLLNSDPGFNPRLLLQMLLFKDCHLSTILLEHTHICQESCLEICTESCKTEEDLKVAFFNLFSCLNNVPKALTQILQPYLERSHMWEHLYTLADTTQAAPAVISCVRAIVTKSTNSLLVHLVSMVMGWQTTEEPGGASCKQNVPERVLAKIPKDWNYPPLEAQGRETNSKTVISVIIQALSFIFTNLPSAVASVPLPVRFLFQVAEKHLSQHAGQLRLMGLLLWALLGCLIQGLEDSDTLEQISGLALDRGAREPLYLLAECLQATMGIQQKGVPKPTVQKVLQALEEKRPKWTNIQLQKARKLCTDSVFERGKESGVAAAELTEQKIGLMLLEICHKAGGSDYLRQIYHIIQSNEELLMFKLSGRPTSPNNPPHSMNFDPASEGHADTGGFNPLYQFDHIGKKKLDQSAAVDWAWDWPRLLPAYQSMCQVTFKTLLANSRSLGRRKFASTDSSHWRSYNNSSHWGSCSPAALHQRFKLPLCSKANGCSGFNNGG